MIVRRIKKRLSVSTPNPAHTVFASHEAPSVRAQRHGRSPAAKDRVKPRTAWVLVFFTLVALLMSACGVAVAELGAGCEADSDCGEGRVCLDRICRYAEEADDYQPAEDVAWRIVASLSIAEPRAFVAAIPTATDLDWAFDWREAVGMLDDSAPTRQEQLEQALADDVSAWITDGRLYGASFVEFIPGDYRPIPAGENLATRPLDTLENSQAIAEHNGEEIVVPIARLIRFRGRWKVFSLGGP